MVNASFSNCSTALLSAKSFQAVPVATDLPCQGFPSQKNRERGRRKRKQAKLAETEALTSLMAWIFSASLFQLPSGPCFYNPPLPHLKPRIDTKYTENFYRRHWSLGLHAQTTFLSQSRGDREIGSRGCSGELSTVKEATKGRSPGPP